MRLRSKLSHIYEAGCRSGVGQAVSHVRMQIPHTRAGQLLARQPDSLPSGRCAVSMAKSGDPCACGCCALWQPRRSARPKHCSLSPCLFAARSPSLLGAHKQQPEQRDFGRGRQERARPHRRHRFAPQGSTNTISRSCKERYKGTTATRQPAKWPHRRPDRGPPLSQSTARDCTAK